MMDYIKSGAKWMKQIEKKALENKISIDSMLVIDATWMLKKQKK